MKLSIIEASYHRNGVGGIGFYAILFNDLEAESENQNPMIASLFDGDVEGQLSGFCAVYSVPELKAENIAFAQGNSWRGDRYESALRPLLKAYLKGEGTNRLGPFALRQEPKSTATKGK